MNMNLDPVPREQRRKKTLWRVIDMGLIKALVGGTIGLAVGAMTCAPLTGMVGGAFIAQDYGK